MEPTRSPRAPTRHPSPPTPHRAARLARAPQLATAATLGFIFGPALGAIVGCIGDAAAAAVNWKPGCKGQIGDGGVSASIEPAQAFELCSWLVSLVWGNHYEFTQQAVAARSRTASATAAPTTALPPTTMTAAARPGGGA